MKIGELAQQTGLAPSKIRFYEAEGLIGMVDRSLNGYRQYSARTKQVLELIILAQSAGFSLGEIRTLVLQRDKVSADYSVKLAELRKKLSEIEELQSKLAKTHTNLQLVIHQLENTPPDSDCFEAAEGILGNFR
jgi:DNA-binding transcriptional MerR regulator